jgi:2-succinyl-5-enolpyruvyl-6-hydroxy-3-cyclohexene-1-carboxylate synthase
MFSSKRNVLETVALLRAYSINQVVLSPGSRNAPLIHTITQHPFFTTHQVLDERNAAFFALGIIQKTRRPVAVCCTSGTALLNFAPAVAEAFYANLPLIVISADRAPEWIGQMDGQTIPQQNALAGIVKKHVQIPEITTDADHWHANRLLNEALIAATAGQPGPVHVNVPISEPLFDFSTPELPEVRKIHFEQGRKTVASSEFADIFQKSERILIVVGQLFPSPELNETLELLAKQKHCVVLAEHLSNLHSSEFILNFDTILSARTIEQTQLAPDLLISFGGHIVSKRLKLFLRKNRPQHHFHLSEDSQVVDLFQSLTHLLEVDALPFFHSLLSDGNFNGGEAFSANWKMASQSIPEPSQHLPFSDISVMGEFFDHLPKNSALHLANSSVVRNAELFTIDSSISVCCNRGTNGIESSLPSAIGYASVSDGLTFLAIGDLSFFYAVGALWNIGNLKNLRILLINNRGGAIFHLLPGMNKSAALPQYIAAGHDSDARLWAEAAGLSYLSAKDPHELDLALPQFVSAEAGKPLVLEVFTEIELNKQASDSYYAQFKK